LNGYAERLPLMGHRERIVITPGVHFGKPHVAGTRIPAGDVLELVQEGIPFDEIVTRYYPDLDLDDVKACVVHADDVTRSTLSVRR
jgi:uncharacterized protein (DUF433 family)